MNTVIHFPAAYNFGPVDPERLVYGFREPTSTPGNIRPDVIDAVLDSHMIARLVTQYGASKRDIANTFGPSSRLGRCAPCKVLTTSADWSVL
jgi:hypothetical protein